MNNSSWISHSVFYHIYPLGMFGAPKHNDFSAPVENRIDMLYSWLDHLQWLGVNALYLGPVFESVQHGYDTVDYFKIDRRLGDAHTFSKMADEIHRRGMRLVLDGVFNHVGRLHFAFVDVQQKGPDSDYAAWFAGLDFNRTNPLGDPFTYDTWDGHYDLPKLNLKHPAVREHLLSAVSAWIDTWQIDGLRLDAADCLDFEFMEHLNQVTKSRNPEFWLMGEVVHGNYANWVGRHRLDAVTNYECYKGLYSSLNDKNYFEIAYALNRQFGAEGVYRNMLLYNFVDNHDVNRIASQLKDDRHLYPLYGLLFTMPGVPSIYYGSEWGLRGERTNHQDDSLRPTLDLDTMIQRAALPDLPGWIKKLAAIRKKYPVLSLGNYQEVVVQHVLFIFQRSFQGQTAYIMLNATGEEAVLNEFQLPPDQRWRDVLSDDPLYDDHTAVLTIPPYGMRLWISE